MEGQDQGQSEVDQFILDRIESVPHLEALLLIWRSRPKTWTIEETARRLYLERDAARNVLEDLVRDNLLVAASTSPKQYSYTSRSAGQDHLVQAVEEAYGREVVRITNLIHTKPPKPVRKFARAFRITKERD